MKSKIEKLEEKVREKMPNYKRKTRQAYECLAPNCPNTIKHFLLISFPLMNGKNQSVELQYRFCTKHKKEIAEPVARLLNENPKIKVVIIS